ncbi:hypothetical protein [Corticicoccus populi]|uniref:Uncharacterized protein n=1 Tax=Corticicoccus populi TaxID=1812821 RepID=A0ABW5WSC9_9STAP
MIERTREERLNYIVDLRAHEIVEGVFKVVEKINNYEEEEIKITRTLRLNEINNMVIKIECDKKLQKLYFLTNKSVDTDIFDIDVDYHFNGTDRVEYEFKLSKTGNNGNTIFDTAKQIAGIIKNEIVEIIKDEECENEKEQLKNE